MAWWMKGALALALIGIVYLFTASRADTSDVEARALVAQGALLLDVRSAGEFAGGHIEGASNIPVGELPQRLEALGADRARPIVVYCASGNRSAKAQGVLKAAGFSAVHNLGAMARW